MCRTCEEIDTTIAHYKLLKKQIADQQTNEAADRLMTKLEAKKLVLHPPK